MKSSVRLKPTNNDDDKDDSDNNNRTDYLNRTVRPTTSQPIEV